jgi:hypothetical protein
MNVSKRSDQVFQLSLTEIAFTISFILLLLLGYLVMRESEAKREAEEALAKVQELGAAQEALNQASSRLKEGLAGAGATKPDEIISRLVADAKAVAERDRLQARVKDLEAQISALAEIKQTVAEATKEAGKKVTVDRVVSALALQAEAERAIEAAKDAAAAPVSQPASAPKSATAATPAVTAQNKFVSERKSEPTQRRPSTEETRARVQRSLELAAAVDKALREAGAKPLPAGKENEAMAGMVRAAQSLRGLEGKGVDDVLKENADLRGQMATMRNRFIAVGRGLDHPPCWADEAGNTEYLFNVELRQGVAIVTPAAWSQRRRQDAEKLPGVAELTAAPVNPMQFRTASRLILEISKRQVPECRHVVFLNNTIESRREADQARWMVEEFFYKREARR